MTKDEETLKVFKDMLKSIEPKLYQVWLHGKDKHKDNTIYKNHAIEYHIIKGIGHIIKGEDSETKLNGIYHAIVRFLIAASQIQEAENGRNEKTRQE